MLEIVKAGNYRITAEQLQIRADGETVLSLQGNCDISVIANTKTKIHVVNEGAEKLRITAEVTGNLLLTLASFSAADLAFELKANLWENGARIKVVTASISAYTSAFSYYVDHHNNHTFSEIDSYGVCLSDCDYSCQLSCKINPGCKDSEAYQNTRVLTAGSIKKIKVLPILEMAENMIKAKHACSIGRLAEEQQYYLASFGLDELQVTKLIAKGYLSNILQEIETRDLKEKLQEQIEGKVNELCLM